MPVIVFLCFDQISKIGCKQDAGCSVVVIDTKQAAAVTEEELEGHRPASVILNAVKSTASYREVNQQVINVGGNKYTADVKPTTKQILGEYTEQPTAQETVKYTTGTQINLTYPNKPVADNRCWDGSDDNGNDDKDDDSSLREDNSRSKETINDFKFEFTQKKDKILKQPIEISEVGGMNARLNERSTRDHDDQDVKAEDHYNTKLHIEQENKEQDTKIEPLDKILVNNKREKERQHHTINSHETISNKIMSLQSEVKAQNERFAKLDKTKSKLERENKEKDNKIEELETLLTNNISKTEKLKNTIKECNKLSKQNERVQSKMKTQNEIAEFQLRQIIKEKDTKIDTLEQLTANNKNEIQKQTIQIEDHKKLLEQNMTIQSERKSQNDRLENLEKHQSQLEHEINEKDTKIAELDTLLANHKSRIEKKEDEIKCNNIITNKNKNQIANLEKNIHQLQNENKKKYDQMQKSKDDQVKITKQIESLNKEVADKRNKVTELEQKSKLKGDEIKHLKELYRTQERETGDEIQKLKALYRTQEKETGDEIHKLKELLGTQEKKIRKLRNTIQDLKGNVRVFCRVRPLLTNESERNDGIGKHWIFPDQKENTLSLDKSKIAACPRKTKRSSHEPMEYNFSFDKVFTGSSTQDDVFKEISQLVHSAIDGYHVCIFAYGQTGSGKTYTMEGPYFENGNNKGMIPRAVQKIFCTTRKLESAGWQYSVKLSCLEIYTDIIRDLLLGHSSEHVTEKSNINITVATVTTEIEVNTLFQKAFENRSFGETNMNERSSRSHSVFVLELIGNNYITGERSNGKLNLVDLAGNEKLKQSLAEGQRLKETKAINKSLSLLKRVITCKRQKTDHIPYRDSKLTNVLRNSLDGNSKTLMFVHVSPREDCFEETLNSLQFATEVNQCNIGIAKKI